VRPSDLLVAWFALALAWMVAAVGAAAVAIATDLHEARWVALHLAFVGGISQLVLGAAQFFACAFLATDPPPRRLVRAQLATWNAGALAVAVGVPAGLTPMTGAGGTLLLVALALFAAALRGMRRRSLQRAPWAVRWYYAAAGALAAGAVLGPFMAGGAAWSHGSLLGAHLALNLGGWFGAAIVGTLHTFYPSLTGTALRRPRLQAPTFAAWMAGVATLALGAAFDVHAAALAGWAALGIGGALLAVNLLASFRAAEHHSPAAALVAGGQALLLTGLVAGLVLTAAGGTTAALTGPDRVVVAGLIVGGWIGLTVAGSLLHLLALMARVRRLDRPPAPEPRALALIAAATVIAGLVAAVAGHLAGLDGLGTAGAVLLAAGYLMLLARIAPLGVRAVRAAPLRV
jgi:nitrite reductase (NO-forming)